VKVKVVIADDHPLVILGVRYMLERDGTIMVVGAAEEPGTLLNCLAHTQCDVVVTKFAMPARSQADGLMMLKAIREAFPLVRIVALTMLDSPLMQERMRKAGAVAVLNQLGDPADLPRTVMAAYQGRSLSNMRIIATPCSDSTGSRSLSWREVEVVRLCASGMSITDIARRCRRSVKTISTQKHSAMKKLGIKNDAELFHYAEENGLARLVGVCRSKGLQTWSCPCSSGHSEALSGCLEDVGKTK
jgi:two-component system capsular synthesis response regulator RcsB